MVTIAAVNIDDRILIINCFFGGLHFFQDKEGVTVLFFVFSKFLFLFFFFYAFYADEKLSLNPSAKKSGSPAAAAVAESVGAAADAALPLEAVVVAAADESAKASVVKGDAPNASSIVAAAVVDAPHGSTTSFMGVTEV